MIRFYLLLLPLTMLFLGPANGQSIAQLDKKNGFRDAKMGAPLKSFRNLILTESEGNTKYYRRKTDVMQMRDVTFADITYGFYKGRLSHVFITVNGVDNSRRFAALLESLYGEGERLYP